VVLISGRGSNLAALIKATQADNYPAIIAGVVSNKVDAAGLSLARDAGIPTAVVAALPQQDRAAYDTQLQNAIDQFAPDLLILAGFMRILTPAFVDHYAGRIVNIHPSLLPSFPGLNTHQRALDAGLRLHGCTVHFVTAELDHGPIIAQVAVPVFSDDSVETLSARVLHEEHRIYPMAVRWFAEGRLTIDGQRVLLTDDMNKTASLRAPDPS
jgi:phosphoribosylglycinamide formyltransferase 1